MIYAASDLHGCYDKYIKLLEHLSLRENDSLYILGDIVDRGDAGMRILLDLSGRKQIHTLRGNHDHYALTLLNYLAVQKAGYHADGLREAFEAWLSDGGNTTYAEYLALNDENKRKALSYLNSLPLFEELEVNGQKFFLSHTVPKKEKMLSFEKCRLFDFITGNPEYDSVYFNDTIIVTGHTPTGFIDADSTGKIWRGNNHIAIDCGTVFGNPLGCLCLDTMEEIYVE